ncbi:SLC13 family permease [Legionella israelensis]|uniref:Putative transporter n=1 Tax=Legionella israelensis TaxID=454 RepID=A0A0W0VGV1_9GAMM|nr:SLC13 family permease [Legionella israelensis]KTD19380.1 putative transporter [Legionella israelensis]QBS08648.1 SLC13 family permease [Legionella israelensis]SCY10025.1 TrkA-C domain-containing protein [Legionella israelensis DSM 19235]STX58311.1 putative citrate transporter [Legionella israelensis]
MYDAYLLFIVLILTLVMFVWGYYRYDTVALMSLLSLVFLGIIPSDQAFSGFSNPAVITVAAVMAITAAISQTGLIEFFLRIIMPILKKPILHIGLLCFTGAFLSAFMNNVGALALLMPLAVQSAINAKLSPSKILMPLSFATVLGGMTTKIGTPPNLLVSSYKFNITGSSFEMFDFLPVGLSVCFVCLIYIVFIGWRHIPARRKSEKQSEDLYQIHDYISEIKIPRNSPVSGMKRYQLENLIEGDFSILGLIRKKRKRLVIAADEELQAGDILIVEASHEDLNSLLLKGELDLVHGDIISPESLRGEDISIMEAVVTPGSRIEGRSWQQLRVRSTYQINLLAVARSGRNIKNRLNHVNLNAGDVVLVQGLTDSLQENIVHLGLVPLAERTINVGFRRNTILPLLLFLGGIIFTTTQMVSVSVCFAAVVVLMVMFNIMPMRRVYQSIDWSIIILLGALIPLGDALKSTGAADLIGQGILALAGTDYPALILVLLLIITMSLSDMMNNAATAVVMSPIATNIAYSMHMNVDAFLMAVAVGASCSFLTPISHQNNTLILGPGKYKFFDYLFLGFPVEIIVILTATPALIFFWL